MKGTTRADLFPLALAPQEDGRQRYERQQRDAEDDAHGDCPSVVVTCAHVSHASAQQGQCFMTQVKPAFLVSIHQHVPVYGLVPLQLQSSCLYGLSSLNKLCVPG